jgi:tetrapyrrole methylase family protein/MazG family protein
MQPTPLPNAKPPGEAFAELYRTVCRLRAPDGCPWDREQTPQSMRTMLLEEAFEAITAIDAGDDANLREELGDVVLIATMIARMKEQEASFSAADVLTEVVDKLRRRHPHVFPPAAGPGAGSPSDGPPSGGYPTDADGVLRQWERIKQSERSEPERRSSALESIGSSPSPLRHAVDLQTAAATVGFDWDDVRPVFAKVAEELAEVDQAAGLEPQRTEEELGDLLFAVVNLARHLQVDALLALNGANQRFRRRFQEVERRVREAGATLGEVPLVELDRHWEAVKRDEKRNPPPDPGRSSASSMPTASSPVHNADPP